MFSDGTPRTPRTPRGTPRTPRDPGASPARAVPFSPNGMVTTFTIGSNPNHENKTVVPYIFLWISKIVLLCFKTKQLFPFLAYKELNSWISIDTITGQPPAHVPCYKAIKHPNKLNSCRF